MRILFIFLLIGGMSNIGYANTVNVGNIPVTKTSVPFVVQNGSITDTGTDSGSSNVGIGTVNPKYTLDIHEPLSGAEIGNSDNNTLTLQYLGGSVITQNNILDDGAGRIQSSGRMVANAGESAIVALDVFSLDGFEAFVVGDNTKSSRVHTISNMLDSGGGIGNMGIGSFSPGQALDVVGTIRASLGITSVGIGTTVPQELCRKANGSFGVFNGTWTGTCT